MRALSRRVYLCAATLPPRDELRYDVVIVGGGPAGLGCAIRLKQLCGESLSVCLIDKGAEIGSHTLSGACVEPRALRELFDENELKDCPIFKQPVTSDRFYLMTERSKIPLPLPGVLHNSSNYVGSLGGLCVWLGEKAAALSVDVFPGMAAAEPLYASDGSMCGVGLQDSGVSKQGQHKDTYVRGPALLARHVVLAEGCRGSITKRVLKKFDLRGQARACPPSYALGLKEAWEVPAAQHSPGAVVHAMGWPLAGGQYGGAWMYDLSDRMVSLGLVVGLDYTDPHTFPFGMFQRMKHHPLFAAKLSGGQCVRYGARVVTEGGLVSLPAMAFPGGILVGDAAGVLNGAKLKGTHTSMKSGMIAAESIARQLAPDGKPAEGLKEPGDGGVGVNPFFADAFRQSWVWKELHAVRNVRPAFMLKPWPVGMALAGLASLTGGREPWTYRIKHEDNEGLLPLSRAGKAPPPFKPDGKLSFDRLTQLALSGTNHVADQPQHLQVANRKIAEDVNLKVYGGPETKYCPAGVYEFADGKLVVNAQNCLHCKACDIKDPSGNINWQVPEGGGGPGYGGAM